MDSDEAGTDARDAVATLVAPEELLRTRLLGACRDGAASASASVSSCLYFLFIIYFCVSEGHTTSHCT